MPLIFFYLFISWPITLSFFRQHWRHNVAWMSGCPPFSRYPSHSAGFQNIVGTTEYSSHCFLFTPVSGPLTLGSASTPVLADGSGPVDYQPCCKLASVWISQSCLGEEDVPNTQPWSQTDVTWLISSKHIESRFDLSLPGQDDWECVKSLKQQRGPEPHVRIRFVA